MRPARALDGSFYVMGTRVPRVVGLLIGLTLAGSTLGAVGYRNGFPVLLELGVLRPGQVWDGEVWRLLTWVFFETDPLALIFACLCLFWFGRDLSYAWGPARFLSVYLGFAVASGGATCLLARFLFPSLMGPRAVYLGSWPLVDAILIAWAVLYPNRQMLAYLVIPIGGRALIYFTVGGTLLYALLMGFAQFIPHFAAEALMLAYVREPTLYRLWLRMRLAALERSPRRRPTHLRPVDRDEWGKPPRWLH